MKKIIALLVTLTTFASFGKDKSDSDKTPHPKEYHVSVNGKDANDGSLNKPLKTIMAAANKAMPGDVITVHAGVYREQVNPPRGGTDNAHRITYQAAKGEKVVITGAEPVKNWEKVDNDTWKTILPAKFFGDYNPFADLVHGDYFISMDRPNHTASVYLNGDWLREVYSEKQVLTPSENVGSWFAMAPNKGKDDANAPTTIWAQFKGVDPNKENVEIAVRPTVFSPTKAGINYITVRGFKLTQAATNWAPPTAGQIGIISAYWNKGWIIENNEISYTVCAGVALGKYLDQGDNFAGNNSQVYTTTIDKALKNGWNKETVGTHIVRNNHIHHCEQNAVVGSMGCAFSIVEGNEIHDIHVRHAFSGYEMAGIKFHGFIDGIISNNHIYNTGCFGIWLDWMAQGVQVKGNLLHDNSQADLFIEVSHGPALVSNNISLSKESVLMNSQGTVFGHNIFGGKFTVLFYDSRQTPWHLPHSTNIVALHDNPSGETQFINNLFVNGSDVSQYSSALLPVRFDGNIYTKGSVRAIGLKEKRRMGEVKKDMEEVMKKYKEQDAVETNALVKNEFDAANTLSVQKNEVYLEITLDKSWLEQKRKLMTSSVLGKASISNAPFENPDGSELKIDKDYLGNKRNVANPSPGPFEILSTGKQKIKVWTN
ncbi:right-handed parallel beta-helix repeat-containing protein [Flavobacterium gilvum]|uniref:right-handed parallel beta-helix repeat-containing protein n=1 Tax=Flavobacterium gilvum TaxID=1492737 RepID=UPI000691FD91|nr:right-handed parallel beta-helix repeat-containing protein [Flavobacterium gilvum]